MFLMFNLGRPDVLALDDLGLRSAARQLYGLENLPSKRELEELGERWRPFRTVASWYLWQSTRIILPDATPSPPTSRKRSH
jgi:DNA-3-methyladenine glycosylase II